jgi:ribosomal protein S27E
VLLGVARKVPWEVGSRDRRAVRPETMPNGAFCWQQISPRCRDLLLVLSTQPAASCHTHAPVGARAYARHCPETSLLYRTIQEHWATFLADLEAGGGELPTFVLDEFEAYLRCGIPVHGFLRVRCKDCGHSRVVAFACKRRGFCPSCLGRRMADTAVFCVDYLFSRVPTRQYVLSLP